MYIQVHQLVDSNALQEMAYTQKKAERVIAGLSQHLEPGGYLFVGHAESLARVSHSLEYVRPAVYRKPGR